MIVLMAAVSKNNVIGNKGVMPWHIPEELQFFKQKTMHQDILMGRKTWEHIPSDLNGRNVYILSHHKENVKKQGYVEVITNIEFILQKWQYSNARLIICGGAEIYQQFLPYASELWISHIPQAYDGDAHFPIIDKNLYSITECQNRGQFQFSCYVKK